MMFIKIAIHKYRKFLFSKKHILIVYLLIFLWEDIVSRIVDVSSQAQLQIGLFEPFILMFTEIDHIMIFPLVFIVLLYDYPMTEKEDINIIYRTGKNQWHRGGLIYSLFIIFTYIFEILISSVLGSFQHAGYLCEWSSYIKELYYSMPELYRRNVQLFLSSEVIAQGRPLEVLIHSSLFSILFMFAIAQTIFLFYIIEKRNLGIIIVIIVTMTGWITTKFGMNIRWYFPVSHMLYGEHYKNILSQSNCSIFFSYLYFIILNFGLYLLSKRRVKRCVVW